MIPLADCEMAVDAVSKAHLAGLLIAFIFGFVVWGVLR